MSQDDGVITLAGEFVSTFYKLVVSDEYAEAIHLYKDGASISRGSEGARATTGLNAASEIAEFHQKVKGATAEITSIDATQLKSQEIVITVVVSFKAVLLLVVQTLVLEAELIDDETSWTIVNDSKRMLVFPPVGLPSANARPLRLEKPRSAKAAAAAAAKADTGAKAEAAAAEPAKAAEVVEKKEDVEKKEEKKNVVEEKKKEAVASEKKEEKTSAAGEKPARAPKKAAAAGGAKKEEPAKPSEPAKPAAPKSWANVAAVKPAAATEETSSSAPAAAAGASSTAAAPKDASKPARNANAASADKPQAGAAEKKTSSAQASDASSSAAAASGEISLFFTASAVVDKDAVKAKLAELAPIKDLATTADSRKFIATFTTTDDAVHFTTRAHSLLPLKFATFEVTTVEPSRKGPETLRKQPRSGAASGSSPSAPRPRGPRGGAGRSPSPSNTKAE